MAGAVGGQAVKRLLLHERQNWSARRCWASADPSALALRSAPRGQLHRPRRPRAPALAARPQPPTRAQTLERLPRAARPGAFRAPPSMPRAPTRDQPARRASSSRTRPCLPEELASTGPASARISRARSSADPRCASAVASSAARRVASCSDLQALSSRRSRSSRACTAARASAVGSARAGSGPPRPGHEARPSSEPASIGAPRATARTARPARAAPLPAAPARPGELLALQPRPTRRSCGTPRRRTPPRPGRARPPPDRPASGARRHRATACSADGARLPDSRCRRRSSRGQLPPLLLERIARVLEGALHIRARPARPPADRASASTIRWAAEPLRLDAGGELRLETPELARHAGQLVRPRARLRQHRLARGIAERGLRAPVQALPPPRPARWRSRARASAASACARFAASAAASLLERP